MSEPHCLLRVIATSLFISMISVSTMAQDAVGDDQGDLDQIEAVLDANKSSSGESSSGSATSSKSEPEPVLRDPEKLSDLSRLQSFSEISVIQRRYLPKTERFQLYLGISSLANDPWFWGMGLAGRAGYAFTESLALEANFAFLGSSEKDAVKDLRTNNSVRTGSIITMNSYMGVDFVWSPIYGKMGLFNKRIVPFDMYFSFGAGQTGLSNATTSSATSFHVGGGQVFAMSKNIGLRWDLSWNFYNATPQPQSSTSTPPSASQFNNLLLTIGASFFFPEAKYR